MKKMFLFIFSAAALLSVQSCGGEGPEDGGQYIIDAPELIVSNPVPCLDEEVTFYFRSDISGTAEWDLGDGTTSSDLVVKHTYKTEGKYNVTLRFSDGEGGSGVTDAIIEVAGRSVVKELAKLAASDDKIWICAHRAHTYDGKKVSGIPENSIRAIKKSIETGVEMVEIDVRTTKDGELVLMHDATVTRTTNGNGNVNGKTLAEIRALRMKANNGTVTDDVVPTLEEALLAGRGKVFFNIDLSGDGANIRDIVKVIEKLHMLDRVVIYKGGNKEQAAIALAANKNAVFFPWVSSAADVSYWSGYERVLLLQMGYTAAAASSIVSAADTKGRVCYTNSLNDPDEKMLTGDFTEIDKIVDLGVKVIQTDYAEKLRARLEE